MDEIFHCEQNLQLPKFNQIWLQDGTKCRLFFNFYSADNLKMVKTQLPIEVERK
jgi:hypothetical protein